MMRNWYLSCVIGQFWGEYFKSSTKRLIGSAKSELIVMLAPGEVCPMTHMVGVFLLNQMEPQNMHWPIHECIEKSKKRTTTSKRYTYTLTINCRMQTKIVRWQFLFWILQHTRHTLDQYLLALDHWKQLKERHLEMLRKGVCSLYLTLICAIICFI